MKATLVAICFVLAIAHAMGGSLSGSGAVEYETDTGPGTGMFGGHGGGPVEGEDSRLPGLSGQAGPPSAGR
uniref:Putative secreted protein n=1 Tax=Ixodes scapularis TaxID=6945 RepID=Q4PN66_IXOSC|nr:putative secreted protein [Ixodes scapularis]